MLVLPFSPLASPIWEANVHSIWPGPDDDEEEDAPLSPPSHLKCRSSEQLPCPSGHLASESREGVGRPVKGE